MKKTETGNNAKTFISVKRDKSLKGFCTIEKNNQKITPNQTRQHEISEHQGYKYFLKFREEKEFKPQTNNNQLA